MSIDICKKMSLCYPQGIFASNGEVFICDTYNHRVRKVLRNGQIVTICGTGIPGYNGDGQPATLAQLNQPYSVAVSSLNQVYISEFFGLRIRKIDQNGIISTIAGTGQKGFNGDDQLAMRATIKHPCGLFVTDDEQVLFCDSGNHLVRKIDQFGRISTIAGKRKKTGRFDSSVPTSMYFRDPNSVFQYKNEIYITETDQGKIFKISKHGTITNIAGKGLKGQQTDGIPAAEAQLKFPLFLVVHQDQIYFSDGSHRIRKIYQNGIITTIAGTGDVEYNGDDQLAIHTNINSPTGISIDSTNGYIYFCESNNMVRKIDSNGVVRGVVGTLQAGYSGDVPFDFEKYPHIGPKRKQWIKPFPKAYFDLVIVMDY